MSKKDRIQLYTNLVHIDIQRDFKLDQIEELVSKSLKNFPYPLVNSF